MATVAPSSDQAAELMQKLSLESQSKTLEAPEATKKSAAFKRGSTDSKESNGTTLPSDRSTTAANPEFADPNMCYLPNGYASAYYYGGYDGSVDWDEYSRYLNADATGVYGDNSSLLYHGYGYSPYGPYSPATSPVPSMGHDGLYGPQQYQYPTYYQNPTTPNEPYNATKGPAKQTELSTSTATDKPALSVEVPNGSSKGSVNGASNGSLPLRPSQQNSSLNSNASYGRGTVTGGLPSSGYVDPRYNFDGLKSPLPWYDTTSYTDTKNRSGTNYSSVSHANSIQAGRNQSLRPFSNLMGLQSPGHTTGIGATPGYMNRYYPNNRMYGQYGSNYRTGSGYGSTGYDSRTYGRGWLTFDGKYKTKGRGNGFYGYGNENMDGLNELNRGPRARGVKTQKVSTPVTLAVKGQDIPTDTDTENKDTSSANADREQYNREDFPVKYTDAKFYVIKSYSEDDVHKSIKYNVWASTPNGNKKLADGYQQAQEKAGGCPVFLMFSVNTSGQFVGLAEMIGPVDFDKTVEYWQQDKWNGCFPLKWHIVKDIPNSLLKHITLENNDNKPVTNSRDTQEVKLEQGLQVLKIFKEHSSKTCILDDFEFYEGRQKTVQEKKAKQQQYQKQVWEGKNNEVTVSDEKEKEVSPPKEGGATNGDIKSNGDVKSNGDIKANGDVKQCEDGEVVVASKETPPKGGAKSVVTENGHLSNGVAVANGGC